MLCHFKRTCDCTNNRCTTSYPEDMIRSQLIAGLRNAAHQLKVLSEMQILTTLELLTKLLLTLESTEKASSHFRPAGSSNSSTLAPVRSDYQRRSRPPLRSSQNREPSQTAPQRPNQQHNKCRGCGRSRHPQGRRQCPAYGKNCNKCSKPNHFAAVCLSSSTAAVEYEDQPPSDEEEISYLSSMTAQTNTR